ncbi:MAG: hypothetical protein PWP04_847 [Candidatus Atribacteria bacterium]|nr:hypothetical protein [Candidatus Atribacteria bacterium]
MGNQKLIRKINRSEIIELIKKDGPLSRVELTRRTGLSLPSISRIVNQLIKEQLVLERGKGPSSGGKKPILLEINANRGYAFGVELARKTYLLLCNLLGEIIVQKEVIPNASQGPYSIANSLLQEMKNIQKVFEIPSHQIIGVGIATPGYKFKATDLIKESPFAGWENTDIVDLFSSIFPYPVTIENIARASTLAEVQFGWGNQYDYFFYIYADWGIGGGIVHQGKLLRGATGTCGEFGHITIDQDGIPCYCGNRGCLEQYTSTASIVRELKQRGISNFDQVMESLNKGDKVVESVLKKAGQAMGKGIANLVNLLNPQAVIIGGEIGNRCGIFCEEATYTAKENIFSLLAVNTPILKSNLGRESIALGIASEIISTHLAQLI